MTDDARCDAALYIQGPGELRCVLNDPHPGAHVAPLRGDVPAQVQWFAEVS